MRNIIRSLCVLALVAGINLIQAPAQALPLAPPAPVGTSSELIVQARTICRYDGYCYNTSGRPIYYQPYYHRHHHRHYYRAYYVRHYYHRHYHRHHWHHRRHWHRRYWY